MTSNKPHRSSEIPIAMLANLGVAIFLFGLCATAEDPAEHVHFHLFTRSSKDGRKLDHHLSELNGSYPTFLIIHGFGGSAKARSSLAIKDAALYAMDCNVVLSDWGFLASSDGGYDNAVKNTVVAGKEISQFVKKLLKLPGYNHANLTVVGFSLGAHVAGIASHSLGSDKFHKIIALDAAGPMYEVKTPHNTSDAPRSKHERTVKESLDADDAHFVMAIHTSGDFFGINKPLGHVDFFPNGGKSPQPPCEHDEVKQVCSHYMAVLLFAESLYNPTAFQATKCDSWLNYKNLKCQGQESVYMGLETPSTARGKFFLVTNSDVPYGNKSSSGQYQTLTPQDLMADDMLDEVEDVSDEITSTLPNEQASGCCTATKSTVILVLFIASVVLCR